MPSAWKVGDVILNLYEVLGLIGEGGRGQVYRVRHRTWNMELAVKRPHYRLFTKAYVLEDFVQEAETWVNLGLYPHVASCYYVRVVDGIPMVFAEYVDGGNLTQWIEDGRLYAGTGPERLRRILDIAIQLAWGLQYAHERGLVHSDVKPDNVLLTRDGVAKITDFGIARPSAPIDSDSRTQFTSQYAAPEQFQVGALLTRAVDVWCWAVSVTHMFMKRAPYLGLVAWQVLEIWKSTPVAERQAMPAELYELLRACLEGEPDSRPTLPDLAEALQSIYATYTGRPYARRRPATASDLADRCNNRGVSLLDLDRAEEAEKFLAAALEADPGHLEAAYNLGVAQWRHGLITDTDLLKERSRASPDEARARGMTAWIHLERGDVDSANSLLAEVEKLGTPAETNLPERHPASAGMRRGPLLEGHRDFILALVLGPNGKGAASAGLDRTIRVWNIDDARCTHILRGHQGTIWSLALMSLQHILLSGSEDRSIRLWHLPTGRLLDQWDGHQTGVHAVAVTADGGLAASGSEDGTVYLWDPSRRLGHPLPLKLPRVRGLALSPGGTFLAVATETDLSLWETVSRTMLWRLPGGRQAVQFDRLGSTVLTADDDRLLRVHKTRTGVLVRAWTGHTDLCTAVALPVDVGRAVSAGRDGTVRIWQPREGRCLRTLVENRGWLNAVSISADGRRVAAAGADGKIAVWDLPAELPHAPPLISRPRPSEDMLCDQETVTGVLREAWDGVLCQDWQGAVKAAGQARQVPGYERSTACLELWTELASKLPRGGFREVWPVRTVEPGHGAVTAVLLAPDGTTALAGMSTGLLQMWNLATGRCVRQVQEHEGAVLGLALAVDGRATVSIDAAGHVLGWDLETGDVRRLTRLPATTLSTSAQGRRVALGGPEHLTVLELPSRRVVRVIEAACTAVALSPDGRQVASASEDGSLYLWNVATGQQHLVPTGHSAAIRTVAFAADGQRLLSAGDDTLLRSFDCRRQRADKPMKGHGKTITAVDVSADGQVAVTASKDRQVRLWDLRIGTCVSLLARHQDWALSVAMSSLGRQVLSGGRDGAMHLWYIDWDVEARAPTDWDEGARPCLETFLAGYPEPGALSETDYDKLLFELRQRGYGWLNPAGVFSVLHTMMHPHRT